MTILTAQKNSLSLQLPPFMLSMSHNKSFIFCVHYHSFTDTVIFMFLCFNFYIRIKIDLHSTITVLQDSVYLLLSESFIFSHCCLTFQHSFIIILKTQFSISRKSGLLVMKSLSFLFTCEGLYFSVFEGQFCQIQYSQFALLFFQHFENIPPPSYL